MASLRARYARFGAGERISLWGLLALLPRVNALRGQAFLRRLAYEAGHEVVLWVEPFGLKDSWRVSGGKVIVGVSERAARGRGNLQNHASLFLSFDKLRTQRGGDELRVEEYLPVGKTELRGILV